MVLYRSNLMRLSVSLAIICLGILSWQMTDAAGNPKAGKVIYDSYCKFCHDTGLKGAPKIGDKAAWAERIKKGELKLTHNAFYGHRKMPMHGDCTTCNLQDIADAVAYMINESE